MNARPFALVGVGALALGALLWRFPRRTWAPAGLADGVSKVMLRQYWLDVTDAARPPEAVAHDWLQDLPALAPALLAHFRRVRPGRGDTRVGDVFSIVMFGLRRGRVQVVRSGPDGFVVQTLRQHPESGQSRFLVQGLDPRAYRLMIESEARASSWLDRLAYWAGMSGVQRLTWQWTLRRVLRLTGGREAGHGHHSREWAFTAEQATATL